MSDVQQIKAGQVGKIIQFVTGVDLSAATSLVVRIKGEDDAVHTFTATLSPTDPTAMELTLAVGMLDEPGTMNVDYVVTMADGRILRPDDNIAIEVIDL